MFAYLDVGFFVADAARPAFCDAIECRLGKGVVLCYVRYPGFVELRD